MAVLYTNNASTTLSASITAAATSLTVASGKGALFPAPGASDYFYITLVNTAGAIEIMKVTARSADVFTVTRGQDGTTAVAWAAGDRVELRFNKALLDDVKAALISAIPLADWNVSSATVPQLISTSTNGVNGVTNYMGMHFPHASANYGFQIAGRNDAAYYRTLENGAYTAWRLIANTAMSLYTFPVLDNSLNLDSGQVDKIWATNIGTETNRGTKPANYSFVVNLGGRAASGLQIASGYGSSDTFFVRRGSDNAGSVNGANAWQPWYTLIHSGNFTSQSLTSNQVTTALGYTPYNAGANTVLTSANYTSYSPSLTGSGASGTWGISVTGSSASAPLLSALGNYVWSASTLPTGYNLGIQTSFVSSSQGFQNFGSVLTMNTYSGGGSALQLYVPYSPTYGGNSLQIRHGNYDVSSGNSWTSWKTLLDSSNYTSYAASVGHTHAYVAKAGESHESAAPDNLGAGDAGFYTISGSAANRFYTNDALIHVPYSTSSWAHQIAMTWEEGASQRLAFRTKYSGTWQAWQNVLHSGNYTSYAASVGHTHNYVPINPDGDGNAWTYSDENPTINSVSVGGGQRFGADGSSYEGFLQAKIVNAYNGFVNSGNGYYLGNYDFGANSSTYSTTLAIDSSNNHYGLSMRSGRFLTTYSATTYNWTGSAFQFYWTKVANIFNVGDAHMRIEITTKTDVNYVGYTIAVASVSTWNNSTHSIKLDALNSYDVPVKLAVDNSGNVWLYSEAVWSSYINWRFLDILGSPTIYTSSWAQQLTQPANSAVISPGQGVRGNQGSIASATVYTSSAHQMSALNTLGAITQNGSQVLHAGNYSSYGDGRYVQKTGDAMSGRLTISPGWTTSGRNYSNEWIEFGNYSGLYSPNNNAHFYPNNGSYGSWRSAGSRNGWAGIEFDASGGQVVLMINTDSNTTGLHNNSYGWQFRWYNGTAYVYKNAYGGGTAATVLDSSNYTSYIGGGSYSGTTTITSATAGDTWNSTLTSTTLADKLTSRFTKTNTPASGIQTNYIGGLAWNGKNYLGNSYELATIVGSVLSASQLSSGAYALGQIELNAYYYSSSLALSAGLKIGNGSFSFYQTTGQFMTIQSGGIVPATSGLMSLGSSTASFGPAYFQSVRVNNGWYENPKLLQFSGSLAANYNAMMAGPVTLDTGWTITIETGATLTIV